MAVFLLPRPYESADTLIPQPGNLLAWDRYGYAYNNPVIYNDPSGHVNISGYLPGINYGAGYGSILPVEIVYDFDSQEHLDSTWRKTELIASILIEPADWVISGKECLFTDNCSGYMVVGLLPIIPSSFGKNIGKYGDEVFDGIVKQIAKVSARGDRVQGGFTILGSFPEYIEVGILEGLTYFNIDDELWKYLQLAGDEVISKVNMQFLDDSIEAGHSFIVTIGEGKDIGKWLKMEIEYIQNKGYRLIDGIFKR